MTDQNQNSTASAAGFDVDAAHSAGYTDDEILQHLTATRNFDVDGALKAGYAKADIVQYLAGRPSTSGGQPQTQTPTPPGVPKPPNPILTDNPDSTREDAEASNTRQSAVAGLTGMPTPNMSEGDKAMFEGGKKAGAISAAAVPVAITAAEFTPAVVEAVKAAGNAHPFIRDVLKTAIGYSLGNGALKVLGWLGKSSE